MSVGVSAAIIGGGLGATGAVTGALIGGGATQSAAQQQLTATQQEIAAQQAARNQAIGYAQQYAGPTANELSQMSTMVNNAQMTLNQGLSSITQQQQQLAAASPEVQAAGGQLTALLQGQAASILAPLQQQQQIQMNQMKQQLASQYGSGWESTTNGMDALMKLQNQHAMETAQAQSNAIMTAGNAYAQAQGASQGIQSNLNQTMSGTFNSVASQNANILGGQNAIQQRQASSFINAANGNPVNFGASVPYAGANQIGGAALGGALSNLGGQGLGASIQGALNQNTIQSLGSLFGGGGSGGAGPLQFGGASTLPSQQISSFNPLSNPTFGSTIGSGGEGVGGFGNLAFNF